MKDSDLLKKRKNRNKCALRQSKPPYKSRMSRSLSRLTKKSSRKKQSPTRYSKVSSIWSLSPYRKIT